MEPNQPAIDYEAVLADLEAQRAAIDGAIEGVRRMLNRPGGPASGVPGASAGPIVKSVQFAGGEIAADAFFNMGLAEAAKKYLSMMKRPCSMKEIVSALESGGIIHQSENFYTTVYSALSRREGPHGDLVKVKKKWALAEWYPGRKSSRQGEKADKD